MGARRGAGRNVAARRHASKEGNTVNRTWIRGVTAGIGAGVVLAGAAVVGPSIASGAENGVDYSKPLPEAEQLAAINRPMPNFGRYLRHIHRTSTHHRTTQR